MMIWLLHDVGRDTRDYFDLPLLLLAALDDIRHHLLAAVNRSIPYLEFSSSTTLKYCIPPSDALPLAAENF